MSKPVFEILHVRGLFFTVWSFKGVDS